MINPVPASMFIEFARSALIRGIAPFGVTRVQQLFRNGLPQEFRPAFEFLFTRKVNSTDVQAISRVEALRAALAQRTDTLHVLASDGTIIPRSPQFIAQYSSVTRDWGTFLFLCAKGFRATTILELGSCAGISGSYLASTPTCREFVSIERSPELVVIAQSHIQKISPNAHIVNAAIDDVLEQVLRQFSQPIDFYYVDANHRYEPTLRYFEKAIPFLKKGALVVFDDIHWSKEMWDVWQVLHARQGFSHTLDIGRFGLCTWHGGEIEPQRHNLAKYAGWVWNYAPRQIR